MTDERRADDDADADIGDRVKQWFSQTPPPERDARGRLDNALKAARTPAGSPGARPRSWAPVTGALAAAALLVVAGLVATMRGRSVPSAADPEIPFAIEAPQATRVALVGNFNNWDARATPMQRGPGSGRWTAALRLSPGWHVYAYVVDGGTWTVDSLAPRSGDRDYGATNTLLVQASRP
jgi:predicted carbohydrate-binding protein with CBM48